MRQPGQTEGALKLGPLAHPLDDAAVVLAEILPQDEQREELRLSELVGALGMGIRRERFFARLQGRLRQRDRVLCRFAHACFIDLHRSKT